jgi:hypothetical protein
VAASRASTSADTVHVLGRTDQARARVIRDVGAFGQPFYGSSETGLPATAVSVSQTKRAYLAADLCALLTIPQARCARNPSC